MKSLALTSKAGVVAGVLAGSAALWSGIAQAQDAVTVRLNWFAAGYTAPFYLGVEKGWYKEANLNVTVNEGQGSGPTAQQVAAGQTTFGFVSSDAVVRLVAQGAPVKMVAGLAETNGYCVLVKTTSGIKAAKDLEGRKYGATASSSVARLLPAYLKAAKVPDDSVQRISVDYANLYSGFISDRYEGMEGISYDEPPRFAARGIPTNCLPYSDAGVKILGPGIVASTATIQNNPDLVRRFVAVTLRAYEYSFKNPQEAAEAAKKAAGDAVSNTAISIEQLQIFEKLQTKPLGMMKSEDWHASVGTLKEYLALEKAPADLSGYYTNDFLPKR